MAGSLVKSLLKETITELPDDFSMKSQSVIPMLTKKGVKPEELEYSQFTIKDGKITKADMVEAEKARVDQFDVVDADAGYQSISLPRGQNNPTYREKILTYSSNSNSRVDIPEAREKFTDAFVKSEDEEALRIASELGFVGDDIEKANEFVNDLDAYRSSSRYTTDHFPETKNYLASNRVFDDVVDGKSVRILEEVQSDLHQRARQLGYAGDTDLASRQKIAQDNFDAQAREFGVPEDIIAGRNNLYTAEYEGLTASQYSRLESLAEVEMEINYQINANMLVDEPPQGIPRSPLEKTWLTKSIERELVDAVNEGKEGLMIPIKGAGVEHLKRGQGVQKWYETQVLSTTKKIAKKAGADFEMLTVSASGKPITEETMKKPLETYLEFLKTSKNSRDDKIFAIRTNVRKNSGLSGYDATQIAMKIVDGEITDTEGLKKALVDTENLLQYAYIKPGSIDFPVAELRARKAKLLDELENMSPDDPTRNSKLTEVGELAGDLGDSDKIQNGVEYANRQVVMYKEDLDSRLASTEGFKGININKGEPKDNYAEIRKVLKEQRSAPPYKDNLDIRRALLDLQGIEEIAEQNIIDANKPVRKNKNVEFYLYSSPVAGAFAVYNAYKMGRSEQEVDELLVSKGKTPEEIERFKSAAKAIEVAKSRGGTDEEIKSYLEEKYKAAETEETKLPEYYSSEALNRWVSGTSLDPKKKSMEDLLSEEAETAKDLIANMNTVKPTLTSNLTDVKAYFGNQSALAVHDKARVSSRNQIITMMKEKYDVDVAWTPGDTQSGEKWQFVNKNGDIEDVTPGFWEAISETTDEILGATGGAIAGFNAAPAVAPYVGPFSKPIGAAVGGIVGAVVGSQLDYMRSAFELQEDWEAESMAYKALNATEMAIVGEVLGYGVVKSLGLGWKSIVRAKDFILDGNTEGAYTALKETSNYTDEELTELVTRLEGVMAVPGSNQKEKSISAVAITESGMQDLTRAAGTLDPIAGKRVVDAIDKRAKSVLEATSDISTPNAAVRFMKDLYNYTGDVKSLYNKVKIRATHSSRGEGFSFDYDSIAIDPILEQMKSRILDPSVRERFLLQSQRIRTMTESRSFSDLIELRQLTNDFLFNKNIRKADDKGMLRGVVDRIDDMIEEGAPSVVDDPGQWLIDWGTAKSEYSKMKKLEQTAMFRLVFDNKGRVKPVTPETVTKAMTKYLTTLDGNFDSLLEQLPKSSRVVYEGAVIDTLARKFTVGYGAEKQAVHFPALAEELNKLKFLSPEARNTKNALLRFSEIFKNELPLALTNSNFRVPSFQSYLTTDPVVRAKFELASGIFNYIKTLAPTQAQRSNALIHKTAKLLENPLNAKSANELIEEFRQDPEVLKAISQAQRDAAWARAQGKDASSLKVYIYEGGKYEGQGQPLARIGRHRIASEEIVREVADSEAVSLKSKMLDGILKQRGYAAVENGTDRVRLLK
tara:strand:+ start:13590 stop:17945 length:4356 start_codon:yes stop_codon:yes gene_type:complete